MNKTELYEVIDKITSKSKYYVNVVIEGSIEELVRYANSAMQYNMKKDELNISIRMYSENKKAEININKCDDQTIIAAVQKLESMMEMLPTMKFARPSYNGAKEMTKLNINDELYERFNAKGRVETLKHGMDLLNNGFLGFGALILMTKILCMGDSEGYRRFASYNYIDLNTTVMNQDGAAGHNRHIGRDVNYDFDEPFKISFDKAQKMVNPKAIEPGNYTVILEPIAVSAMMGLVNQCAFNGKTINQGGSYLSGKLDTKVIDERLSIYDDVNAPDMIEFGIDYEGNEKKRITVFENGVFKEAAHDNLSAKAIGIESNGHAGAVLGGGGQANNLILSAGQKPLEQIIKETENGILITMLHYLNAVNSKRCIVTGITRNGTFLVKNGEIVTGIDNMRFTQDFMAALNNIDEISSDRKSAFFQYSANYVPALKINDFKFVGRSA